MSAGAKFSRLAGAGLLQRLRRLPREPRDTLFLLLVIGWTVVPHLGHLPLWTGALAGLVLLWRARLALVQAPLPSRWVRLAVLLLAAVLTYRSHGSLLGKDPGVTLAVVLMALKTLELRARRDAFVVFFLGFFLILTQFFYSQSLLVAATMLVAVWGLLTGLVLAHMPVGQPALRRAGWLAGRTALLGVPVMVLLFVLFPRVGPLWGVPNDAVGSSGLSNRMRFGTVAELAQDESVAMRIRFLDRVPPPQAMYFRGPVLGDFDGVEWRPVPEQLRGVPRRFAAQAELRVSGRPVPYEMTLEPLKLQVLPLLDAAGEAPQLEGYDVSRRNDLQWLVDRPVFERLRFQAVAYTSFGHGPLERVVGLEEFTALPPGFNPRTLQWADRLRQRPDLRQADARGLAQAVLRHIRTGEYSYSLSPGSYGLAGERGSIDEFWLDRRIGFCEHFASAFVVVMRALNVPARVVTGYQGVDPEPVDGFHLVRQSAAHAWAEYWQAGVGWIRADPTAAVAPERVLSNARLASPPSVGAQVLATVSPELLMRLQLGWETLDNRWNQWVLSYSRGSQLDLLRHLGVDLPDWRDLATLLAAVVGLLAAVIAAIALWERQRVDPWLRQMRQLRGALVSLEIPAAAHEAPATLAQRARERLGQRGAELAQILDAVGAQRYGRSSRSRPDPRLTRRFLAEVRSISRQGGGAGESLRLARPEAATGACRAAVSDPAGQSPLRRRTFHAFHMRPALIASSFLSLALAWPAGVDAAERGVKPARSAREAPKLQRTSSSPAAEPADVVTYGRRSDLVAFAEAVAQRHGLDGETLVAQLARSRYLPSVARLIMPPPAGSAKNWQAYRSRFVEPIRLRAGQAFRETHAVWLERAESLYGVPESIILGIIGVETLYGRHMGSFRTLDALATLAFDFPAGRRDRSAFFRDELEHFLVLSSRQRIDPTTVLGSYAGAIGIPQFMPSSILRHAIDFDGDGRIDLRGNPADAIGSVANYLSAFGWKPGMPTHFAIQAPTEVTDRAVLLAPDILPTFGAQEMVERGARLEPAALSHAGKLALVELQNGEAAPSYVAGTTNFYAITRYNWSSYYAMAVIELGRAITGR